VCEVYRFLVIPLSFVIALHSVRSITPSFGFLTRPIIALHSVPLHNSLVRVSLSFVIALHSVTLHNFLVRASLVLIWRPYLVQASLVFIDSYYEFTLAHICHRAIYDDIIQRNCYR